MIIKKGFKKCLFIGYTKTKYLQVDSRKCEQFIPLYHPKLSRKPPSTTLNLPVPPTHEPANLKHHNCLPNLARNNAQAMYMD